MLNTAFKELTQVLTKLRVHGRLPSDCLRPVLGLPSFESLYLDFRNWMVG